MLRLSTGATLISVLSITLSLAGCASTSSGGSSGNTYGTGGGTATGGSSSTGGSSAGGSSATGGSNAGGSSATGGSNAGGSSATGGAGGSSAGCSPKNPSACPSGICDKPGTLHSGSIYCPFSSADGGANASCTPGTEHCCEGTKSGDVSTCSPLATACTTGWTDWVCQQDSDCGSGQQCCAAATLVKNSMTQCANYASKFTGTKCETTCATGEIHMCNADSQCGSGQTCLPFSTKGAQVGGCYQ